MVAGEASITPTSTNKHCACWLASFPLQELIEDYLAHLARPGTPCKTFRIKVFVFMAAEEPLTPDEIMEGQHFFGYVVVGVHGRWAHMCQAVVCCHVRWLVVGALLRILHQLAWHAWRLQQFSTNHGPAVCTPAVLLCA